MNGQYVKRAFATGPIKHAYILPPKKICGHRGSKLLCTTKTGVFCSAALVYAYAHACGFHGKGCHTWGRPLHTCATRCVMDILSHIGTA